MTEDIDRHRPAIRPFRIDIPQADLDDLRERLARTRLPQPAPGTTGTSASPNSYLREARRAVADDFDWRAQEARMNAFPHYLTEIDGQTIHFIHVPSKEEDATPLLLVHTYPGTFVDFLDMIDPLVDPVAHGGRARTRSRSSSPRCPGFGFSTPVVDRGWTMARVARTFDTLMRALGYDELRRARQRRRRDGRARARAAEPGGFLGLTCCSCSRSRRGTLPSSRSSSRRTTRRSSTCSGSSRSAATTGSTRSRPQTVAVGLSDSPVGQLAWNELFLNFGNGTSLVSTEQILTEVSLEWFTNTSAVGRPLPPRGGACRRRAAGQPRADRRRGLHRRLQVDPHVRRPGQRQHRALE